MSGARAPRVSVIIPAFNAEPYIQETLDSVLAQTYPNIEVMVVDDGSTDGTRACVRAYGDRVKYVREDNSGGAARPRNAGLRLARGELLVFIDADDVLMPDRIAREVAFLQTHPAVGLVFSDYREFGPGAENADSHFVSCPLLSEHLRNMPDDAVGMVLDSETSTELLLTENFGHSSPMVRRQVAMTVGGYDESAIPSEDFYFEYQVASVSSIAILPLVGWSKRNHPSNLSANTPRVLRRKIEVRQRILGGETNRRRRRKLKRMMAGCHSCLAYYYTGRDNRVALRHALRAVALRHQHGPRLLARLLLDVLGRNTNRTEAHRTEAHRTEAL